MRVGPVLDQCCFAFLFVVLTSRRDDATVQVRFDFTRGPLRSWRAVSRHSVRRHNHFPFAQALQMEIYDWRYAHKGSCLLLCAVSAWYLLVPGRRDRSLFLCFRELPPCRTVAVSPKTHLEARF